MKKFVFSIASRATGRWQIKPSGSGDENGLALNCNASSSRSELRLALAAFPENANSFYWIWPRIKFSFATLQAKLFSKPMKLLFIVKKYQTNILIAFYCRSIGYRYDEWTTRTPAEFDTKVENWQVSPI